MILVKQMAVLFLYMALGVFTGKRKYMDDESTKPISWYVVNIANPALIFSAAGEGAGGIGTDQLIQTGILACCMYVILLILAEIVPRLFRVDEKEAGLYKFMTVFNNIGFMGFPVVVAAFGKEALLYATIFTMPFNVLFYTYGYKVVSGKKGKLDIKEMLNVGTLSSIIAIFIYAFQIPLPQILQDVCDGVGNVTAPISLFVTGVSLSNMKIRLMFADGKFLLFTFTKLLIFPVVGVTIIKQFVDNPMLVNVCMVILGTPVASMTVMVAQQFDRNFELASKAVAFTTLLSVITIPIVSALI